MIKCSNLVKKFRSGSEFYAVNDINIEIKKGEFVAVTGKSGSGKSTLMNMIGLIERQTSGEIFIDGDDTRNMTDKQLADLRNKKIGYIFQAFHLEYLYSVFHNVEMPLLISDVPSRLRKNRVKECLLAVGLEGKADELAGNLSGGEKQRVCIARALANDPEIILADEPCGNLDSENTENIMNILKELNKKGKTIVLITHNMDEARMADRIIFMKDGKLGENV